MNHEIEDHRHVGSSWLKAGQTKRLDKAGLLQVRRAGTQRRVEALDMADGECASPRVRERHEVIRLFERSCQGLLDENVAARVERSARHRMVLDRRHRDHGRVRGFQKCVELGLENGSDAIGHTPGPTGIDVAHSDQFRAR
jgi:hypothetical protein